MKATALRGGFATDPNGRGEGAFARPTFLEAGRMGIFDDIKKMVTGNAPARAPSASSARPAASGLPAAQQKRRASGELRGRDGKVLTGRRLKKYESLERAVVADAGFPFTSEQARAALARRGFRQAHVDAYLASPAARRLLE